MNIEITQLAGVFAAATLLGLVAKRWRQPLIIAYVLFGEHPSVHVLLGAVVVIAAGLMVILDEHRPRRRPLR